MKAWVRRQVDQLCLHAENSFTDIALGGTPTDEFFGATGDEGVSESAARSDHLHGMPDIEDILNDDAFFFDDAVLTTPNNVFVIHTSGAAGGAPATIGGRDDVGSLGAFGSFDIRTANSTQGSCGAMMANAAAANNSSTLQIHLWQRVKELAIRCSPGVVSSDLNQVLVAVGAMRSTVNFGITAATVANITDGVYFLLTTDAAGAGNWFATTMNNGTSTSVDTGVSAIIDGSSVGYQNFQFNYDHATTTVTFTIDDEQVATISTNVPPSTRKVSGFGMWTQNINNGLARQLNSSFDRLLYVGDRVAQA
jgi:hypothetical protein